MEYIALSLGWILAAIAVAWGWNRWTRPVVALNEAAFDRWLRAGRPPFNMFLGLAELEQERLAQLGDMHSQDMCLGIGYAVRDPDVAKAGREPENVDNEVVLLEHMLAQTAAKVMSNAKQPKPPAAPVMPSQPSMAGVTERRTERSEMRARDRKSGMRLFGREPDRCDP